jgi:hypothetical protein
MGFITNLKESIKKSAEQDRLVRERIKEVEFEERMKQAEVLAKAKVDARVKKKIDAINGKRKPLGKIFAVPEGEKDKGNYNFITGKFENEGKVSVPKVTTNKELKKEGKTIVLKI